MFPDFNRWSIPLLILVIQGLIFVGLLTYKYFSKRNLSDLLLALILLLACYAQICYTVGFMGWYDTYRNTKINYFLINIDTAIAPLIYFYVKSITTTNFSFKKREYFHFLLPLSLVLYRIFIFTYDASQTGFASTQNGILKIELDETYVQAVFGYLEPAIILVYLAFTFQLFFNYRAKILQFFSNTYKMELNWVFSFLILFGLLFIYSVIQDALGSQFIDLGYQQRWWFNLVAAIVTLYLGISGFFIDANKLKKLKFNFHPSIDAIPEIKHIVERNEKNYTEDDLKATIFLMENERIYLNPDLNLSDMAEAANMSRGKLSEIINTEFKMNFNDFINNYRVNAFKNMIATDKLEKLSLLGIAEECGFKSKATFNRVFKKFTQLSPTEYLKTLT